MPGTVLIVGGTAGMGRELANHYAGRGRSVVLTGRDAARAAKVAGEIGGATESLAVDLSKPGEIAGNLAGLGPVDHVVLTAIDRDANSVRTYDIEAALHLVTLKLVGYTEVVHTLGDRLTGAGSILLFGGMARTGPYPGSTTVSSINAAVVGMARNLSVELAPTRVNSIHPGIVGDSPFWTGKPLDGDRSEHPYRAAGHHGRGGQRVGVPVGERCCQRSGPGGGRRLALSTPVAVVGTGRMGAAMAGRHASAAGHPVTVYNRTPERAQRHRRHGGVHRPRGRRRGRGRRRVPRRRRRRARRLPRPGRHRRRAGDRRGRLRHQHDRAGHRAGPRRRRADAAVHPFWTLRSPAAWRWCRAASSPILAGGDEDALDRARPVLGCFGSRIVHLGGQGTGATMKLVVNSVVHALNQALAEALVLAERAGVDRAAAYDVFTDSAVAAPFVQYKRESYVHPETAPVAFALDLVAKDLRLIDELARSVAARMPQLAANASVVDEAIRSGYGDRDLSALAELLRSA